MARLTNLGPGDLLDRLTILALKILHKGAREHWVAERAALLTQVNGRAHAGKALEGLLELGAVNAALWAAEDALRALRPDPSSPQPVDRTGTVARHLAEAGELAFRIQALNDRRSLLIDQINQATGDFLGAEK